MLNNSTTDNTAPAVSGQERSFVERGFRIITIQYSVIDKATGGLSHRSMMIPTDMQILPELHVLYADTVRHGPLMRKRINPNGEGNFFLIDRDNRIIGCVCLDMHDLSDSDVAWIHCMLAESEGAVLALVGEPSVVRPATRQPRNLKKPKKKRSRS